MRRSAMLMLFSLLLAPCALRADPLQPSQGPEWVRKLPVSETYLYFRGDGIDPDYEKAKLKARADAFRKVQLWSQAGVSDALVDRLKITTEAESLATESTIAWTPGKFSNLEWVEDYEDMALQDGRPAHHYYLLLRYPRKPPSAVSALGRGLTGRADAVFHSMLYPGWGQMRQGRTGEGVFFTATGTLAGLTAGACYVLEKNRIADQDWRSYRRGAMYALAGVYAANLVDALIYGRRSHERRMVNLYPGGITVSLGHGK